MSILTRQQREALKRVYDRPADNRPEQSYLSFRRTVQKCSYDSALMVQWCGMWLGIETDGYIHS